jgi:hypothetical protein
MNRLLQMACKTVAERPWRDAVTAGDSLHHPAAKSLHLFVLFRFLVALSFFALCAGAHTLPVSYLRMVANPDYLHIELIFNPFELTFVNEVDENKDGELDPGELKKHGQLVAKRVSTALKVTVDGKIISAETVGMDPDMSGHHVRLRAHYKIDARLLPVTLVSELGSITSSSHLVQVTFLRGEVRQLAQLDSHSKKVTFDVDKPSPDPKAKSDSKKKTRPKKHGATVNPSEDH